MKIIIFSSISNHGYLFDIRGQEGPNSPKYTSMPMRQCWPKNSIKTQLDDIQSNLTNIYLTSILQSNENQKSENSLEIKLILAGTISINIQSLKLIRHRRESEDHRNIETGNICKLGE